MGTVGDNLILLLKADFLAQILGKMEQKHLYIQFNYSHMRIFSDKNIKII